MSSKILEKIDLKFKYYDIKKIKGGASKKNFYRIQNKNNSYIVTDFGFDNKEYKNYLEIYYLLSKTNISIPKIIDKSQGDLLLVSEDLGNLRFDNILDKQNLKELLQYGIDTLVEIQNNIKIDDIKLNQYNFDIFKKEISELPEFYFRYKKIESSDLTAEFLNIWSEAFNEINLKPYSFVHKDFNINNLILLPKKKGHLKCGVIDFQSAFWGESSWDLFSFLEDSRTLFSDKYNEYYIDYLYSNTKQTDSLGEFRNKFYFFNTSRQTRLLGRWIKLTKELNQKWYMDFIPITKYRLQKSITNLNNSKLNNFYSKYILN